MGMFDIFGSLEVERELSTLGHSGPALVPRYAPFQSDLLVFFHA